MLLMPMLLLLLLLPSGSATTSSSSSSPPAPACDAAAFGAANLSGFRLSPGTEHGKHATAAGCLAVCCGLAGNCTAWNYHVSSANPKHNVRSCWLSLVGQGEPQVTRVSHDSTNDDDVWVGGSRTPVRDVTPGPKPPCAPTPCPNNPGVTYCTSNTSLGQCKATMPHAACPPCLPPTHYKGPPIPQCNGTDYAVCRRSLWKYVFNTTTGLLPSKAAPDYVTELPDWEMKGFPGPGQGTGVGNVSWKMGLQKLVWEIGRPGGGMQAGMLRLNSTGACR